MTYATKQDLIDRFGSRELVQLTDRTNTPPTTIDDTVVGGALADATAMIDGYLAPRYALPIETVPEVLTRIASDIARYYLHGKAADDDGHVARAHREAVAWLKDVSKGLVSIEADGVATPQAGGGTVRAVTGGRLFTRDTLEGL